MARIRKHRDKWQVLYRDPATRKERSAGVFRTKAAAKRIQLEVEHRIAVGRWIDPDMTATTVTLADWWGQAEPTWLGRTQSTRDRDRSYFKTLIAPDLGEAAIASIDRLALERWVTKLDDAEYSPATIVKAAQLLTRVLQDAVNHHLLALNPALCLGGKLPSIKAPESLTISVDEAHRLADEAGGPWRAFVLFGFYAGTRWGETAALRRSRVNLRRSTALIDASLTRNLIVKAPKTLRSRRTIHLPGALTEAMRTHLNSNYQPGADPDLVFTSSEGGPIRYTNWRSRVWIPAAQEAGLDGLRFHDLRHSHASLLIDAGIDPVRVSRRLGHARTSITLDRYSHLLDRDEEAILRVFADSDADRTRTNGANVLALDPH
jgi:integrase